MWGERQEGDRYITTLAPPSETIETVHHAIWRGDELLNRRIEKCPVSTPQDLRVITPVRHYPRYCASSNNPHAANDTKYATMSGCATMAPCRSGYCG